MITFVLKIQMKHVIPKCSSSGLRVLDKSISCSFFDVLLTVPLSIILAVGQLNAQILVL